MKEVTMQELEERLANGEKLNIIDVREDEEVAQGMIPEAKHIRLGEIPERTEELNKDEHYFLVCRSGGRSGRAGNYLSELGYNVTNVTGGMLKYKG